MMENFLEFQKFKQKIKPVFQKQTNYNEILFLIY